MVALYFMFYNLGRVPQTLRVTPAMEARIAEHGFGRGTQRTSRTVHLRLRRDCPSHSTADTAAPT